jgi:hypothetical protein
MTPTPNELKTELKKRLKKSLKALPPSWVNTFIHVFPDYTEMKTHLYNVARGKSLDENVILKMEQLAETLKPKK